MKTKKVNKILSLLTFLLLCFYAGRSQTTGLSGTGANTDGASTAGTECTHVGGDAGFNNAASGNYNTNLGFESGYTNNTYDYNTMVGYKAGRASTAEGNTFIGAQAGFTNSTGGSNTASGNNAGYFNATGSYNTVGGYESGKGVTGNSYSYNTFYGYKSGFLQTTGQKNVFVGAHSGYNVSSATQNTFVGYNSGATATTGGSNTLIGYVAGYLTTGEQNTFMGTQAGYNNSTGDYNTYVGLNSGYANTTGEANVAVGMYAGDGNATGANCTYLGYSADANGNYANSTALGNGTVVNANNKIRFGNAAVTVIEGTVAYTWSDGRFKFNVAEDVKGLDFITRLRPVNYQMNTAGMDSFLRQGMPATNDSLASAQKRIDFGPSTKIVHTGFIAQEVEQAAKDCGYISNIVHSPESSKDNYSIAYGAMVVPLVKAVQEQQIMIEDLKAENAELNAENVALEARLSKLEAILSPAEGNMGNVETDKGQDHVVQAELTDPQSIVLYQNEPNPFEEHTAIRYFVPANVGNPYIVFHNEFGVELNRIAISETGFGRIEASTETLASGVFSYSLIANDKVIDTKKMVKTK